MLNTPFQAVDLHILDLHTTVRPLTADGFLKPDFKFLTDPALYRTQYASGASVLTKSFDVHPLSKHSQTEHHFWRNYLDRPYQAGAPDVWALQAPFLASLRNPKVRLAKGLSFDGRIKPVVYLSTMGWSTNLNIHLRGSIQLSALLDFILGMIGKKTAPALELNDKPAKLSTIFGDIAKKLLDEVYANNPTTGSPEIFRHMIISLSKFGGKPLRYKRTTSAPGMNTADQALMHSLVRGELISVEDFAEKTRNPSPTVVEFGSGPDFMLLYFDYGALLFLQESAARNDKRQRALSCVASNMRTYAIMIWSLYYFYRATQQAANQPVADLRALVELNLKWMKERYLLSSDTMRGSVKYAKALFSNHKDLKRLAK